jgi:hypothetical protein
LLTEFNIDSGSTVALESLPTGVPVFVSFWKELIDAEERGHESQFLEVLGHCPNFRNYVIAILNQERKFLAHDSNFELAKRLASKVTDRSSFESNGNNILINLSQVKTMSSLTQKLVSSRSLTLISDILKDYPSVDAVKDPQVFVTVSMRLYFFSQPDGFLCRSGSAGTQFVPTLHKYFRSEDHAIRKGSHPTQIIEGQVRH